MNRYQNNGRRVPEDRYKRSFREFAVIYAVIVAALLALCGFLIYRITKTVRGTADESVPIPAATSSVAVPDTSDPGPGTGYESTTAPQTGTGTEAVTTAGTTAEESSVLPPVTTATPPVTTVPVTSAEPPVTTAPPVTTDPPVTTREITTAAETQNVSQPEPSSPVILAQTPDAGADYLRDVVFLGDSTTYGLEVYGKEFVTVDQIISGDGGTLDFTEITTKKVRYPDANKSFYDRDLLLIGDAVARRQPKILVVTLGLNFSAEANGWEEAKLKKYFQKQVGDLYSLVKEKSPSTTVVFQTIYPTIDSRVQYGTLKNSRIDTRNSWLLEKCEELNCPVLWSHNYMSDANGQLKAEFNTYHGDGIHLNPAGFAAMIEYLRTHAVK